MQPLLHDEQCTNGNVVFQPKLHLQQTLPLFCLEPYKHLKTTKLNLNTTKEKDNGTLLCHHLLLRHKKEGHGVVFFFFFSNTKETKHTRKQQKKDQKKGGSLPSSSHSALSLLALASAFLFLHFCFKCFFLASSSFQVKKKKTINKKKYVEKGGSLPSSSCSALSLLIPAFTFLFQVFFLNIFFFSSRRKEKKP